MFPRILVSGASGTLGRLVVRGLSARGVADVIAGTRSPASLATSVADDVEIRRVDFDDPASLDAAFRGTETLLVISTDELARPGHRQRQHQAALDAAVSAGVKRVAYTSMPNPEASAAVPFAPDHAAMERALLGSGLQHVILRNGWYQENLLGYLPWIIAAGTWFTAAGTGRIPFVSRVDTADATAAALLDPGIGQGVLDIAGPDYLTVDDIAAEIGRVLDRPLTVEHVSEKRAADALARQGVPDFIIPMVAATEANQRAGAFEVGAGILPELLDRPAASIAQFLAEHADRLLAPAHL